MNMVASLALLLATTVAPGAAEAVAQDTIAVHVRAKEATRPEGEEKKALQKERRAEADAARNELKALEKDVKQQFGKKREQWPADRRAAVEKAEEKSVQASLKLQYLDIDPAGARDSAQDVRESLAGKGTAGAKEHVREVPKPEEADLVAEILGRRSVKGTDVGLLAALDDYYVWLRISAGGRTDPARLGRVPLMWPGTARLVHSWTDGEPYWELEVMREGRWANVGNEVSRILNNFADESAAAIAASRRAEP
jgi:hypothetical protein